MSDTAQPPVPRRAEQPRHDRSDDEKLIDELYFKRDLNEVHLLIDFISGRPERSLDRLTMPAPNEPTKQPLTAAEIVERIASMRYPPDPNKPVVNAENAAILLVAKDHLSALASPARGLTIAYTEMFVGAEGRCFGFRRRQATPRPPQPRDSRVELASATFPALKTHAEQFKTLHGCLVWFCLVWFALTALTYWDVSLGRSVLQRLDEFWKERTLALQATPDLLNPELCGAYQNSHQDLPELKADDAATKVAVACRNLQSLDQARYQAREDLTRVFRCSERRWLSAALHVWCWNGVLAGGVEPVGDACKYVDRSCKTRSPDQNAASRSGPAPESGGASATPPTPPEAQPGVRSSSAASATAGGTGTTLGNSGQKTEPLDQVHWQSAESVLSVFVTYILPMMFGLLGTIIGAFRSIQARVRDSELAPRDYALTVLGLPLGAVAGVAVGLFLSPSSVPMQGSGEVASALTLTASGLGFLGGYGSQTFFRFIDELLDRVFPDSTPLASGSQPVARPNRP